jgi:hypothetical protein
MKPDQVPAPRPERLRIRWNHLIEKESLGFKELGHVSKKSRNFGTCFNAAEGSPLG